MKKEEFGNAKKYTYCYVMSPYKIVSIKQYVIQVGNPKVLT